MILKQYIDVKSKDTASIKIAAIKASINSKNHKKVYNVHINKK